MTPISRRAAIAGTLGLPFLPAAAQAALRWEPRAPIPWTVQEVYGAVWRGQIVIAGGMSGGATNPLDRTGLYDPGADRWREGPRLPSPRHHPALAAQGSYVYAFGGFQATAQGPWTAIKEVLRFDGRAWTALAPMPAFQCETVAVAIANRIHIVSGRAPRPGTNGAYANHVDIADHQVFMPGSGRWQAARPAPEARNSAAGGLIDGKLYLCGGRTLAGGNTGRLDRYDPKTDQWETLRPMPKAAGGLAAAVWDGQLYAFGGEFLGQPQSVIRECWRYDPKSDLWIGEPSMATPRHGLTGVAVRGRVYAIGGGVRPASGQVSAINEALILRD